MNQETKYKFQPEIGQKVRNLKCNEFFEEVISVTKDHFVLKKSGKWEGTIPGWEKK